MVTRINEALLERVAAYKSREEGQAMAEYGLILALIAVVCIVAVTGIGTTLNTKFSSNPTRRSSVPSAWPIAAPTPGLPHKPPPHPAPGPMRARCRPRRVTPSGFCRRPMPFS